MPRCLVLGDARQGSAWRLRLEDLGECWQCEAVQDAEDARAACDGRRAELVLVCAGEKGARFLGMMQARPPMSPPWLVTEEVCSFADGRCSLTGAESLHGWWRAREEAGRLPVLALGRYGQMVCLARGLMTTLNVPHRLRAWEFLPDMLALGAVHPALMEDLRGRLYPLVARRQRWSGGFGWRSNPPGTTRACPHWNGSSGTAWILSGASPPTGSSSSGCKSGCCWRGSGSPEGCG